MVYYETDFLYLKKLFYLCNCANRIDLGFDNCSSSELSDDADDNAEEELEEKEYES